MNRTISMNTKESHTALRYNLPQKKKQEVCTAMKKLLTLIVLFSIFCIPNTLFAETPNLIPQFHWTYHSLETLSNEGFISEQVTPGKSAYTPEQVASMIVFAINRIESDTSKLTEASLSSMRQLINGYRAALEAQGYDFFKMRKDIEDYATSAGLTAIETSKKTGKVNNLSEKAAASVNAFTFEIYKTVGKSGGNMFISPYSISSALAMTYAGARGTTEKEMEKVLHIDSSLHKSMAALISELNSVPAATAKMNTANAIWPAKQEKLLAEYVQTVRENYKAALTPLNYASSPAKAAKTINSWVEKHTNGKIKDIISDGLLRKDTPMVLTNAVYFKSEWLNKFEPSNTMISPFWTTQQNSVSAVMMNKTDDDINYIKTNELEAIEIPYKDRRFSMLVMLPDKSSSLQNLESKLTQENLDKLTLAMKPERVKMFIPKFKEEQTFELANILSVMGMPSAFDGRKADFSAMNGKHNMYIGNVVHKTFIEVGEEGTEAAAATAVIMMKSSMPPIDPPIIFRAERPFVYMIRDNNSGAVIFIGRYTKP